MSESQFQATVINYIRAKGLIPHADMAGGKRTRWQAMEAKRLGLEKGWPDITINEPRGPFTGLAMELKAGYNKPTTEQFEKLALLRSWGYLAGVFWPPDDWNGFIDFYALGEPSTGLLRAVL